MFLFVQGGEVVGREGLDATSAAGGPTDFTLSVTTGTGTSADGDVTLTQLRAVHENTADTGTGGTVADSNEGISLDSVANLVTLTATITDADGDHEAATLDLGKQVTFHDDGPTIALSGTASALSVDESGLPTGSTPSVALTTDTEHFAGAFSSTPGADGATTAYTLAAHGATGTVGVDSGLINSATGNHVFLFVQGGEVVGREGLDATSAAGGPTDFTLSVTTGTGTSADGDVTLTQLRAVHENTADTGTGGTVADSNEGISLDSVANLVTLTATITDADGDHEAATLDLGKQVTFHDDGPTGPTVTLGTATVGVDETPGLQTTGGASDVLGSSTVIFDGVAGTTVASLFATVAMKGTDTDVPSGSLDSGALSFASSGASGIVSVGTLTYGADGPAASSAEKFALTITDNGGIWSEADRRHRDHAVAGRRWPDHWYGWFRCHEPRTYRRNSIRDRNRLDHWPDLRGTVPVATTG